MHNKHTAVIFVLLLLAVPYLSLAVNLPFGGLVVAQEPCDEGLLLYVDQPLYGVQPFMWFYGELPFAMYIVPHVGQWLLGEAGIAPAVCTFDGVTIGEGFPILYHGSSV